MCVRISVPEYVRFNPSRGMWPCPPPALPAGPKAPHQVCETIGGGFETWQGPWMWCIVALAQLGRQVLMFDKLIQGKKMWKYGKAMGLYGSASFSPVWTSMLPRSLPGEIANTMQRPHLFHLCYDKRLLGIAGGRVVGSGSREQRRRPRAGKEG